ncbi:unnamed protein product [Anisakis simplex]|uniref:Putative deoxyhypusine synthase (inferred by orthology to a S. mansoni protein) n=1 Tax=Anisakis simplex TaxID=6269 RepID=A0A0M3JUB8_ANISI|nr:unnamed protein product [Anisakis simplex]
MGDETFPDPVVKKKPACTLFLTYTSNMANSALREEFDGNDSGARPDMAVTWGKIRGDAKSVEVFSEASLVFSLIAAKAFAGHVTETTEITVAVNSIENCLTEPG